VKEHDGISEFRKHHISKFGDDHWSRDHV